MLGNFSYFYFLLKTFFKTSFTLSNMSNGLDPDQGPVCKVLTGNNVTYSGKSKPKPFTPFTPFDAFKIQQI